MVSMHNFSMLFVVEMLMSKSRFLKCTLRGQGERRRRLLEELKTREHKFIQYESLLSTGVTLKCFNSASGIQSGLT